MAISFILSLVAASFCSAACGRQGGGVVGEWVAQHFFEGEDLSGPGVDFTLDFRSDGTFTGRMTVSVMMIMDSKLKGTYKRDGDVLTLSGTNETYTDDGYHKGTTTIPFEMKLKVEGERLSVLTPEKDGELTMVFRRKGTPPLKPDPMPTKPTSEPTALELLKRVKAAYAMVKSYADDGTLTSDGRGFRAKNAKFRIRYDRDGRFLFRANYIEGGEVYDTEGVWSDGKKTWLAMTGTQEERPFGNGLGIIEVHCGTSATLIPSLLLGDRMGSSELDDFESVSLLPDEKVAGRLCRVLVSASKPSYTRKLWIDVETYLIRQSHSTLGNMTTLFNPRVNEPIPASDFKFSQG